MRAFSAIVLIAGLAFLSACGGGGTPVGVQITIALSATQTSLAPGKSTTITATVSNDTSNKGVSWSIVSGGGSLSGQTSTTVVYTAPSSVPSPTAATIMATSVASSTVTATIQISLQSSAISIYLSIPPSTSPTGPQTINQGQQLSVNATLTNDTSGKGVTWKLAPAIGSLSNPTSTSVTYVAPGSVTGNTPVTLTATSVADANATAALEITVFQSGAGPNVAALSVNSGPAATATPPAPADNIAYVSVTICVPGTTTCETVDNIQVDTGSAGLRILQSAMPAISLPPLTDSSGNTIFNCVQFADTSFLWGPVQMADVKIGGEAATAANGELIQLVSTSTSGIPTACSTGSGPGDENTPSALGANGIIGVGLEPTDCFVQGLVNLCDGSVQGAPPAYFSCPSSGCSSTTMPITIPANGQVTNPVAVFAPGNNGVSDNNGVVLTFPAVSGGVAATVSGSLTFGINTQTNNTIPNKATLFGLSNGSFITVYNGQSLTASVIDSGSNALFFPTSIPVCTDNPFLCPATLTMQSATNQGYQSGAPISAESFDIDNADNLFNNNPPDTAVFGTLGGPNGTTPCNNGNGSCTFDWGLPFFYGKTIFTAMDGATVNGIGAGPFWAY